MNVVGFHSEHEQGCERETVAGARVAGYDGLALFAGGRAATGTRVSVSCARVGQLRARRHRHDYP